MLAISGLLVAFVLLGGVLGRSLAVEGTYTYLKLFNEVLYLIRNNYVEPVRDETLMEGAYRGMLENLDPLSEYLTVAEFRRASRGERTGPADPGLILSKRRGYAIVICAVEGSPADKASLVTGDQILTIDRQSTLKMGAWEATQALQGKAGTTVHLVVARAADSQRQELGLVRKVPPRSPLSHRLLEPGVGLLRLGGTEPGDSERVRKALQALRSQGAARLLLDLRSNAGGDLQEAVRIAALFTGEGKVATLSDRRDGRSDLAAPTGAPVWKGPMAILVNGGTAGPAEVLAAALQDRAGGTLVGEKTWGFGSIQKVIGLPGGDGLRLSVGKLLSPAGKDWNGVGLSPDFEQVPDADKPGEDSQLRKGLEILRQDPADRKAA